MNPLLISAGVELIKTLASDDDDDNEKKVKAVLAKVPDNKPFWESKRFWVMITGILIPIVNKISGLDLSTSEIVPIVGMAASYIFAKSYEQKT